MPVSSIQAAVASLVTAVVGLVVGLGVMSSESGGHLVATLSVIVAAAFTIGNAIIHHGVTTAAPGEDASKPKTKDA